MDYLEESIQLIREECEAEKKEIISCLNQMIQVCDTKERSSPSNYTRDYNFKHEVCKYDLNVRRKLTGIKFELKKFLALHKPPEFQQLTDETQEDIYLETLRIDPSKLLNNLDENLPRNKEGRLIKSSDTGDTTNSDEINYPNVCNTLEKLSEHTKEMLKDCGYSSSEALLDLKILNNILSFGKSFMELKEKKNELPTPSDAAENFNPDNPVVESKQKSYNILENENITDISAIQQSTTSVKDSHEQNLLVSVNDCSSISDKLNSSSENNLTEEPESCDSIDFSVINPNIMEQVEPDIHKIMNLCDGTLNRENGFREPSNILDSENLDSIGCCISNQVMSEGGENLLLNNEEHTNPSKPSFTAEEKIMKLGLEDRRTRFEQTREVAFIPDLRLQPSVSDSEKMRQIESQSNNFEIADRIIPTQYKVCVFCHVESPSEFYVHLDDEESRLIDSLNDLITEKYQNTRAFYGSKFDAFKCIGRYCCAFVEDDETFYRAEVIEWFFEKKTKLVMAKLVDYGNIVAVHYEHLRPLTKEWCLIPKIAVRCYFPFLYPQGSTRSNFLTKWPSSSVQALTDLSGLCQNRPVYFKLCYVEQESGSAAVDMYSLEHQDEKTLGQLLIDLGHAVEIIEPTDDPMGILADDEDIRRLEECNNVNEVVLGYDPKDEGRICKFTRNDGTCFKGRFCKLEHTSFDRGGYTSDQMLCYATALAELSLPKPSQFVGIKFTSFISATKYYMNLANNVDSLKQLEDVINEKQNSSLLESYKLMPAVGEIVLVEHWTKRWLRAKVRDHLCDDEGYCTVVQVFMVDYGDIIDVSMKKVRHIRKEYLNLPFQAVECNLHNYEANFDIDQKEIEDFFYSNMVFREFVAEVVAVCDTLLSLEVYSGDGDGRIGDFLVECGFLRKTHQKAMMPSAKSIVIPG